MNLAFLHLEPESPELELKDIDLDAEERELLFKFLHLLDGLAVHRSKDPVKDAGMAFDIVSHFRDRNVALPWDVQLLKDKLNEQSGRIGH